MKDIEKKPTQYGLPLTVGDNIQSQILKREEDQKKNLGED